MQSLADIFALVAEDWVKPIHCIGQLLLFINLVNDSLPAIALGTEKGGTKQRWVDHQRDPNSGIFYG